MTDAPLPKKVASPVSRAMAGSAQGDAAEAVLARRVMDDRDIPGEVTGTDLYETLRLKKKDELLELARRYGGVEGMGKQMLIGIIIDGVRSRGTLASSPDVV